MESAPCMCPNDSLADWVEDPLAFNAAIRLRCLATRACCSEMRRKAACLSGSGIGPFSQGSLDEALGLAVGSGRVGSGADVLEAEPSTGVAEAKDL